jgi:hypothetical protein
MSTPVSRHVKTQIANQPQAAKETQLRYQEKPKDQSLLKKAMHFVYFGSSQQHFIKHVLSSSFSLLLRQCKKQAKA